MLLLVLDCLQTLDIKNHPNIFEINKILGPHPSDKKIIVYFIVWLIGFPLLCLSLPSIILQGALIAIVAGIESWCLINNYRLGLKI